MFSQDSGYYASQGSMYDSQESLSQSQPVEESRQYCLNCRSTNIEESHTGATQVCADCGTEQRFLDEQLDDDDIANAMTKFGNRLVVRKVRLSAAEKAAREVKRRADEAKVTVPGLTARACLHAFQELLAMQARALERHCGCGSGGGRGSGGGGGDGGSSSSSSSSSNSALVECVLRCWFRLLHCGLAHQGGSPSSGATRAQQRVLAPWRTRIVGFFQPGGGARGAGSRGGLDRQNLPGQQEDGSRKGHARAAPAPGARRSSGGTASRGASRRSGTPPSTGPGSRSRPTRGCCPRTA